ncbi:TetR/AcrR family transcriptional regulator [Marmoricola sp. RAF53]|uniref:TetR/AcrR family transcriptional regulator n=1 Tax=Marmoricola sp. RAF53 TaxID=3233059 RepID=UPI003F972D30
MTDEHLVKQTRRRGAVLEQAILDAAWAEVAEHGWAGFSIDAVATRTGTAKAVIYRRWRNRVDLAQEVLRRASTGATFSPTDDLRADLVAFLQAMSAFLRSPFGGVVRGVMSELDNPVRTSIFAGVAVVADVESIVDSAIARGELSQRPSSLAVNLGHSVVMSEFLHTGEPPSDEGLVEFVDTIWLPAIDPARAPAPRPSKG